MMFYILNIEKIMNVFREWKYHGILLVIINVLILIINKTECLRLQNYKKYTNKFLIK